MEKQETDRPRREYANLEPKMMVFRETETQRQRRMEFELFWAARRSAKCPCTTPEHE